MLKEKTDKTEDQPQLFFLSMSTDLVHILLQKRLFFLPQVEHYPADDHQLLIIPAVPEPKFSDLDYAHLLVSLYLSMVVCQQLSIQITLEMSPHFVKALEKLPPVYLPMLREILTAIKA